MPGWHARLAWHDPMLLPVLTKVLYLLIAVALLAAGLELDPDHDGGGRAGLVEENFSRRNS